MTEYVYVMQSRRRPDLCKVGRTSTSPSRRCEQLNSSEYFGVTDWSVAHSRKVSDSTAAEAEAHRSLKHYRAYHKKHREAFAVDFNQARRAVDSACNGYDGTYDNLDYCSSGDGVALVGTLIVFGLMIYGLFSFLSWFFASEPEPITFDYLWDTASDNADRAGYKVFGINDVDKKYMQIAIPDRLNYKKLPGDYNVLEHFKQVVEYVKTDEYRLHSDTNVMVGFSFFENYFPSSSTVSKQDNAENEARRTSWDDLRAMLRITRAIPAEYVYANRIAYSRVYDLVAAKQRKGYQSHYDRRKASPAWARGTFFISSLMKKQSYYRDLSSETEKSRKEASAAIFSAEQKVLSDKRYEYISKEVARLKELYGYGDE